MSDLLEQHRPVQPLKREDDSTDDFEHLVHELQHNSAQHQHQHQPLLDLSNPPMSGLEQPHSLLDGLLDGGGGYGHTDLLDTSVPVTSNGTECELKPVPATPPPSADFDKFARGARQQAELGSFAAAGQRQDELEARIRQQLQDPKTASMAFVETEKSPYAAAAFPTQEVAGEVRSDEQDSQDEDDDDDDTEPERSEPSTRAAYPAGAPPLVADKQPNPLDDDDDDELFLHDDLATKKQQQQQPPDSLYAGDADFLGDIKSSTLPEPEKSPELDFVRDEIIVHEATKEKPKQSGDEFWNVLEKSGNDRFEERQLLNDEPPTKPLPPLPKEALEQDALFDDFDRDYLTADTRTKAQLSGGETGDSEFESEPEPSPAKAPAKSSSMRPELGDAAERKYYCQKPEKNTEVYQISPRAIFKDFGLDAWFNPERLNPKVAALIYWRDPKKSGIVFGAVLTVLLSLAYFSLISVLAYISLLTLTFTVSFRIYKTVLQAVQKTSDGHPFKDILDLDLALPTEKVHEIADIAVANANAGVAELRRLFLVEDFVDSLKFGILLWSLTYLGAWFNGMTLIIIGVVALFTLPKVYETNKTQIDQNLALVQAKINELTTKVKAAIPIGKKADTKEE